MTTGDAAPFSPDWLALREPADAAARCTALLTPLCEYLGARAGEDPVVVRDLGCGTGSMGRWLAGRLPGPQEWILHDHDPALLELAARGLPARAGDGAPVTVSTRHDDLAGLRAADLTGTTLVTASALLDLFDTATVDALADAVTEAGCAALLALSVTGEVSLTPADPLDSAVAAAFNDHQRREVDGRALLGPDAVAAAVAALRARGAEVRTGASPWTLTAEHAALTAEWLRGWLGAAVEERPGLAETAADYLRRRLEQCADGALTVVVGHTDVLVLPGSGS